MKRKAKMPKIKPLIVRPRVAEWDRDIYGTKRYVVWFDERPLAKIKLCPPEYTKAEAINAWNAQQKGKRNDK